MGIDDFFCKEGWLGVSLGIAVGCELILWKFLGCLKSLFEVLEALGLVGESREGDLDLGTEIFLVNIPLILYDFLEGEIREGEARIGRRLVCSDL